MTSCTCPADSELRGPEQTDFLNGYNNWIETKTEEGKITNLRELLSLSESGSFSTESQGPSNNGMRANAHFCADNAFPVVLFYSILAVVFGRRLV